jgi:hypothetical protein
MVSSGAGPFCPPGIIFSGSSPESGVDPANRREMPCALGAASGGGQQGEPFQPEIFFDDGRMTMESPRFRPDFKGAGESLNTRVKKCRPRFHRAFSSPVGFNGKPSGGADFIPTVRLRQCRFRRPVKITSFLKAYDDSPTAGFSRSGNDGG